MPKAVRTAVSGRSAPSAYGTVLRTTTWATRYSARKSAPHVTALAETSASRAIVMLAERSREQRRDDQPGELAAAMRSPLDAPVQNEHGDGDRITSSAIAARRPPGPAPCVLTSSSEAAAVVVRGLRVRRTPRALGLDRRLGLGLGLALDELEEDDRDVVLAARAFAPPRARRRRDRVAIGLEDRCGDLVGAEHVGEAVGAEEVDVAQLRGHGEDVRVDGALGADARVIAERCG
jgi:hypothetical protein